MPTRGPALVTEAASLLNASFSVSAGLLCVFMQIAPHPAQDGVASLGIYHPSISEMEPVSPFSRGFSGAPGCCLQLQKGTSIR